MKKYRAYMVGPGGHVRKRDLRCNDEAEAFELVSPLWLALLLEAPDRIGRWPR